MDDEALTNPSLALVAALHDEEGDASGDDLARERELIERAQSGDPAAFRALYELHHRAVFRVGIMPLVRNPTVAEDLVADTFVRAMENLPRFAWQGKGLLPWLVRIAKNLSLDHLRRRRKLADWPPGLEQRLPDLDDPDAEAVLTRLEMSELVAGRLALCMEDLNPRYRRVLELRLIRRLPRAEAAAILAVSVGTLDVLLFRACKAFRRSYELRFAGHTDHPDYVK